MKIYCFYTEVKKRVDALPKEGRYVFAKSEKEKHMIHLYNEMILPGELKDKMLRTQKDLIRRFGSA